MKVNELESFLNLVMPEPNTGCWIWIGQVTRKGYGNASKSIGNYRLHRSHRVSYYLHNGPFDYKMCVCHTCDNRLCVNPQHLFLGTFVDNNEDMRKKGRASKGTDRPTAKITEADVLEIINKRNLGQSVISIAKEYGLGRSNVYSILDRKLWKHVWETHLQ